MHWWVEDFPYLKDTLLKILIDIFIKLPRI